MANHVAWISWQKHRRTRELARALGAPLTEMDLAAPAPIRFMWHKFRTFTTLVATRPRILIVDAPSVLLALNVVIWKVFFRYRLVVDAHNEAVEPFVYQSSGSYRWLLRMLHRKADLTIVTNDALLRIVEANGGRGFVLPDRIPSLTTGGHDEPDPEANDSGGKPARVVLISSFAADEPYGELFEAARLLGPDVDVAVTGNPKRADAATVADRPDNVRLTDFLPEADYVRLLRDADVLVDLTLMPNCLVCGAYEAAALGKPLVTSDTEALRAYFDRGTVYVRPDARAIADGITDALARRTELAGEMIAFRERTRRAWDARLDELRRILDTGTF